MLLLPCLSLLSGCGPVEKDAYEITFSVGGTKTTETVKAGEVPEYTGKTEWETADHYYKITGWDKEFAPAAKDVTYTAIVGEYGLYDVLFILPSGIVKVPTHEGEIPTPPAGYETDDTRAKEIGTFVQWNNKLTAPTAENTENGKKKMTYQPIYNYEPRYLAEILPVKNGAKGILTMTYDDGKYETAVWVNAENKKYGLNGSCMMVPNWAGNYPNFTNDGGSVAKWNALFSEGTLEPQNHSMTHERIMPDENWGAKEDPPKWQAYQKNWIQEVYYEELVQSKELIEQTFPDFDDICFAPSNNTLSTKSYKSDGKGNRVKENGNYVLLNDGGATKVAQETFFAIRKGNRAVQSLDPTLDGEPGGWYNLCIRAFKDFSGDAKLTEGKKWLDDTVKNGNWLIVMCHGITATGGDIKQSLADQFFAYAGEYVEGGKLWAATFSEATKYLREKQNTTVSERYDKENNVVYVDMKINRTTGDGKFLDPTVFNYPLTVEVRVPSHWQNVRIGDATTYTPVEVREDGCYVLANLVPGADGVTVTTAIRP